MSSRIHWQTFTALILLAVPADGQISTGTEHFEPERGLLFSQGGRVLEGASLEGAGSLQDFSLAVALEEAPRLTGDETLLAAWPQQPPHAAWLGVHADRTVAFKLQVGETVHQLVSPPLDRELSDGPFNVVVSVRRDPRQALAGLHVNGVEQVSKAIPPGKVMFDPTALVRHEQARIDLYERALQRWEILDWGWLADGNRAGAQTSARLAVLGGSDAVALMESGWFEAGHLAAMDGETTIEFEQVRSLAWESDSVFQRDRPVNFGDLRQQLVRTQSRSVLLFFGRSECLERGREGLAAFHAALTELVKECQSFDQVVWLAGLVPFEAKAAPLPDLSVRNDTLRMYDQAVCEVAVVCGARFLDVQSVWPDAASGYTTDGFNLSDQGTRLLGGLLVRLMHGREGSGEQMKKLLPLVVQKNRLWERYWRPSNWAFLHGDRTAQPSSRHHENPHWRWFPGETEMYLKRIEEKEVELARMTARNIKKLP